YVGRMTGLEELSIGWGFHLTDKGFGHLSGLKRLRILDVDNSKMTDASLDAVGKLTNLEQLQIAGEGFTDRGLARLEGLSHLKSLSLGRGEHRITDAGLDSVKRLKSLEHLELDGSHLSDEGIATLRKLTNLKTINMGLPSDRRDRLQRLLPGVKIE